MLHRRYSNIRHGEIGSTDLGDVQSPPSPSPTPTPTAQYAQHAGVNCYAGNGGTPVEASDAPVAAAATAAECLRLCDAEPACAAVTRGASDGGAQCWLRSAVALEQCQTNQPYDTWTQQ